MRTSEVGKAAAVALSVMALAIRAGVAADGVEVVKMTEKGVPGGAALATMTVTAKVTEIDAAKRKVTLVDQEGGKTVYTAGPEVLNFDQIKGGDELKVTVANSLVVALRKKGSAAVDEGGVSAVVLPPKGAKPGMLAADSVQVTAKVDAIDMEGRKATLSFGEAGKRTFKVRDDVDLTKVAIGDEVMIRYTEALLVRVEKP